MLMGWSLEDLSGLWMADYWPSTRAWEEESHPKLAQLLELMPGARRIEIVYRDLEDGSLAALGAYPEKLVDPRWHRQTSYFERLERDHPEELKAGLDRLRDDLAKGTAPRTPGTASVLVATKARRSRGRLRRPTRARRGRRRRARRRRRRSASVGNSPRS